jgi:MFS family permease
VGYGRKLVGQLAPSSIPKLYYELNFIGFSIMMGMSLPASFLPILAENLDPSGLLVGLVVSAWFLSRIFLELPAGIISDRIGRRKLLIFGIGSSAFGPLLCSQASNIYLLILGRAVWGLGTAFYFMNNTAILMDILPVGTRGRALGLFQGIEFVGSFIGAPIGAFLAVYMTFNQVFYFALVLTLITLPVAVRSRNMRAAEGTALVRSRPALREVFSSLRDWGILAVCLSTLLRMLIMQGIFQTVFQLYMNNILLFSVASIGVVLSFRIAGQIISLVTAGILSDRVGRRPVLLAGFIVTSLTLTAFTMVKNFELLLLVGFVEGLGEGFGLTTLIALLTDIAPPSMRGGAVGLYRTFQDIGGFSGPVTFMLINNGFGSEYAFYAAAAFSVLNIALISTFRAGQIKAAS